MVVVQEVSLQAEMFVPFIIKCKTNIFEFALGFWGFSDLKLVSREL